MKISYNIKLGIAYTLSLVFCGLPHSLFGQNFHKKIISYESFESVAVFDVNNDGVNDIVSGAFWYEGPHFLNKHLIGNVNRTGNGLYWDQFGIIPMDVNGDGFIDFVTGDWFNKSIWWVENPGKPNSAWKKHFIDSTGNVEMVCGFDLDNDGIPEIIPNTPGQPLKYYKLIRGDNGGEFKKVLIGTVQGHGLGFGDLDDDGYIEFITADGWFKKGDKSSNEYQFHKFEDEDGQPLDLNDASIPIICDDFNRDGLKDLFVGNGHGYGLSWYEQKRDVNGRIFWEKHILDPFESQFHAMAYEDLDGDGLKEIITGKRFWAHNGSDPGALDPIGLYYFKWNGQSFAKNVIAFGKLGVGKGTGLSFKVIDLNDDNKLDIVVAGKDGLVVFFNR